MDCMLGFIVGVVFLVVKKKKIHAANILGLSIESQWLLQKSSSTNSLGLSTSFVYMEREL